MNIIKTIAGWFTGGSSLAWVWLLLGAAAMAVGVSWHSNVVESAWDAAYTAGQEKVRAEYLAAENRALLTQQERIATLITEAKEAQDAYEKQGREVAKLRDRLADANRLRNAERTKFDANVKSATADRLRDYAQACDGNFERSRSHVERFGLEAIECSKAAHALKKSNDSLSRPSAPRAPSRPTPPGASQ